LRHLVGDYLSQHFPGVEKRVGFQEMISAAVSTRNIQFILLTIY